MPSPDPAALQKRVETRFMAYAILLPRHFAAPIGPAARQFHQAFSPKERCAIPVRPALFQPATHNAYHVQAAAQISASFSAFIAGVCQAICQAWNEWQAQSTLSGVVVQGPIASGGTLSGPGWHDLILAKAPVATEEERHYSTAIAKALGDRWQDYQAAVQVPGLAWYPAFAAVPAPIAPPTPNLPCPVSALTSGRTPLPKEALYEAMTRNLNNDRAVHHRELFFSLAEALEEASLSWQSSTMVSQVLATGPVPSFAPPVVPAGPVVGGQAAMAAGGLL